MRFSESWLREWVDPPVDTATLADQLSMAGLEVDAVEPVAPGFSGVVVGSVVSLAQHPNADKLRVCQVDTGQGEDLQIICGAANVAAGMRVAVARVGAVLPGDFRIKKARLRGVESYGMICSAAELGLADTAEGILPLPEDAPLGQDVRDYLQLDDQAIELDLTPDRGDCFSLAGVAREVGVINRHPVTVPAIDAVAPVCDDRFPVYVDAPDACPRYVCRIIRRIDPGAETPLWMQERLRRSGLRSLGPVVDVTNYVLLELGQPLHAFDLARLDSEIRVRMARPGETLELLSSEQVELRDDTLVIADGARALAMAGIMGGEQSGVTAATRDILLESAFFTPTAIIGKARSYGQHTDASHRFERGVDPQLQVRAAERATRLLLDIVGGEPGPVVEVSDERYLPEPRPVGLRRRRIARVLGLEIDDASVENMLSRLGMTLEATEQGWQVTPPSSRFDIGIEEDLIEEIGRIYGYTEIPMTHAHSPATTKAPPETAFDLDRAKQTLVSRGYYEAVVYSFVSPELQRLVDPGSDTAGIRLANPISADMSVMRTSLWPGLLQTVRQNQARQQERVRVFESGLRFRRQGHEINQESMLSAVVTGSALEEQWGAQSRPVDFFDLKADLEAVLALTGCPQQFTVAPGEHPALHPGQSARIERSGESVGWIGMLHPAVGKRLDLGGNAYLFEIRLDPLQNGALPAFEPLSKYPSIRRDLAITVDRAVSWQQIRACVASAAPEILKDISLFDVYTGEKIDSGRKSLALGLILQASSHTLMDEDVEDTVSAVLKRLESEFDARLRD
jgi:phenylalanyl-tRNA synthetase beta chain